MMDTMDVNEDLQGLAASIDISEQQYEEAVSRYDDVAVWLSQEDSPLWEHSPTIYAQGSFRLGTMVRPFRRGGEFDIDLVCQLLIARERTTQAELKESVGARLRASAEFRKIVDEHRRCWTLDYPGEFHLDVLPAIPDAEGERASILLTDKELRLWQHSNPVGYADWFFDRMRQVLDEARGLLAKSAGVSIEEVPQWRVRTPLQRGVQLLKRHRDVHFTCDDDRRPVSIIITTLAARAYGQERDVESALRALVREMPRHIEYRNGRWWVENPANPAENFADKWNEKPERRAAFLAWLQKVEQDIGAAQLAKSAGARSQILVEGFGMPGSRAARGIAETVVTATTQGEYVPALSRTDHVEKPRWPEAQTYKCRVRGSVYRSRSRSHSLWPLSDRPVPKNYALRFEADTNVPLPYEVQWQVVNTGREATSADGLRGDFYDSQGGQGVRWETTAYTGTHWVEAFVVKNGVCMARSGKKLVRIKQ